VSFGWGCIGIGRREMEERNPTITVQLKAIGLFDL
jgi:hypothetical protein